MSEQMNRLQSSSVRVENAKRSWPSERSNRTLVAAVVAGGLALSASLHPLPGDSMLRKLLLPSDDSSNFLKTLNFSAVNIENLNYVVADLSEVDLHDFARLVELGENFADLPTPVLLGLAKTYGLTNLVQVLDFLAKTLAMASGGGGGAVGGATDSPTEVLPIVLTLLHVVTQNASRLLATDWSALATAVLPTVLHSLGIPVATAIQKPEVQRAAITGTAALPPNQEPAPTPSPEPQPASVQGSGPASDPEPTPLPTVQSTPQPTKETEPTVNPVAISVETPSPSTSPSAGNLQVSNQTALDAQGSDTGLVRNSFNASQENSSAVSGSTPSGGTSAGDTTAPSASSPGSSETSSGDAASGTASGGG